MQSLAAGLPEVFRPRPVQPLRALTVLRGHRGVRHLRDAGQAWGRAVRDGEASRLPGAAYRAERGRAAASDAVRRFGIHSSILLTVAPEVSVVEGDHHSSVHPERGRNGRRPRAAAGGRVARAREQHLRDERTRRRRVPHDAVRMGHDRVGPARPHLVMVGAAIAQFVAWVAAVANTAGLPDNTWFVILLVTGLFSFGFVAMIVYLVAGPGDPVREGSPMSQGAGVTEHQPCWTRLIGARRGPVATAAPPCPGSPPRPAKQTRPWSTFSAPSPATRQHPAPRSRWPGCWPRSPGSSRSSAPRGPTASRRTSARSRSSSPTTTYDASRTPPRAYAPWASATPGDAADDRPIDHGQRQERQGTS